VRKGERLVLLTTDGAVERDALVRCARTRGAADIMVPGDVLTISGLPLLGSGKPDYVAATALARERTMARTKGEFVAA
jgi:acyl-[acyl-carrier-protein]-phospholipid O-acyltransferase/long-chain-fatty-acid--[acyl-carrier-protein] ligase